MINLFRKLIGLPRNILTEKELLDLQELNRMCILEKFKSDHISKNSVLFKNGPTFAKQQEDVSNLLEKVKNEIVAKKLTEMGYPQGQPVTINMETGKIKRVKETVPVTQLKTNG